VLTALLATCFAARSTAQTIDASAQMSATGTAASATEATAAEADASAAAPTERSAASAVDVQVEPEEKLPFDLVHRGYNTFEGSSGGMFVDDPGIGEPGAVRLQLAIDTYSSSDFLYEGDSVEQDRQTLSIGWSALPVLEIWASMHARGTFSDTPAPNSLHTLGDLMLGFKVGEQLSSVLRLGGSLRFLVLNDVGEQETLIDATSIGLRGSLALDFQGLDNPVPFILRTNLDYLFDNSAKVLGDVEKRRYAALTDPRSKRNENRHLINRVERFGLGVNRVDLFTLGLGIEVPLELADDLYLHPGVDFRLGMPVNRQGYDCPFFSSDDDRGTNAANADDTCVDDAGAESWPMNLALGARVVPPLRGVTLLLGVDFGLLGTDTFVRELAPNTPFKILLVLGYDYDAEPVAPVAVVAPPPPPPPPTGRVFGKVSDQLTGAPIANVIVRFAGSDVTPLATGDDGRFASAALDPGEIELELSHPDYEPRQCQSQIPATGGDVEMTCSLTEKPVAGSLQGSLHDQFGAAVAGARVQITGPTTQSATSDVSGTFVASELAPGEYTVRVESDSHLVRVLRVTVDKRQQGKLEAALLARPSPSGVSLRGGEIKAKNLVFAPESTDLSAAASQAVAELADLLLRDASLRRIRIQGDGGESLALPRALAVKQRLVDAGVPDTRIEAGTDPAPKLKISVLSE
jgi:outer membrane protein OmpA-like peptidoglycan-associated protein